MDCSARSTIRATRRPAWRGICGRRYDARLTNSDRDYEQPREGIGGSDDGRFAIVAAAEQRDATVTWARCLGRQMAGPESDAFVSSRTGIAGSDPAGPVAIEPARG